MPRDMHNIPFALNESPSEKEGKLGSRVKVFQHVGPQ